MTASAFSHRHRPWLDLPSELLGIVLARLASHADRVRFSAVCPAWRSSALLQRPLPPLLPWLRLRDGAFLSLPDGAVHRFDIPGDVLCWVSIGSVLFLVHADGSCSLMNPSSSATTRARAVPDVPATWFVRSSCPLNTDSAQDIRKVVFSEHLVALLFKSKIESFEDITSTRRWQRRSAEYSYLIMGWLLHANMPIADIAIFKGELYLLTTDQELLLLDDQRRKDMDDWGICGTPRDDHEDVLVKKINHYLVVSGEQLLMVKRLISLPPTLPTDGGSQKAASQFEVFEATDLTSSRGRWTKVDNLTGRALFISEGCSESLPVTSSTTGIQEDCIYFVSEGNNTYPGKTIHESPFLDSGVYNMTKRTLTPLPFDTVRGAQEGRWSSTWLFPET